MVARAHKSSLPKPRQIQSLSRHIRQSWTPEERLWRIVMAAEKRAQLAPILFDQH